MTVNKPVAEGTEGYYNLLGWLLWKLARVARSILSAESQIASEVADALFFTCIFWKLIWKFYLPLDDIGTARMIAAPKLIIDTKPLYDLLSRLEIQANFGTDKRTTIKILVTQDKLACYKADTNGISSE